MNHIIPTSLSVPIPPATGPEEPAPAQAAISPQTGTLVILLAAALIPTESQTPSSTGS